MKWQCLIFQVLKEPEDWILQHDGRLPTQWNDQYLLLNFKHFLLMKELLQNWKKLASTCQKYYFIVKKHIQLEITSLQRAGRQAGRQPCNPESNQLPFWRTAFTKLSKIWNFFNSSSRIQYWFLKNPQIVREKHYNFYRAYFNCASAQVLTKHRQLKLLPNQL